MPGSNERSIQVTGEVDQVCECARSFLDDISKVGGSHMSSQSMVSCYTRERLEMLFISDTAGVHVGVV